MKPDVPRRQTRRSCRTVRDRRPIARSRPRRWPVRVRAPRSVPPVARSARRGCGRPPRPGRFGPDDAGRGSLRTSRARSRWSRPRRRPWSGRRPGRTGPTLRGLRVRAGARRSPSRGRRAGPSRPLRHLVRGAGRTGSLVQSRRAGSWPDGACLDRKGRNACSPCPSLQQCCPELVRLCSSQPRAVADVGARGRAHGAADEGQTCRLAQLV